MVQSGNVEIDLGRDSKVILISYQQANRKYQQLLKRTGCGGKNNRGNSQWLLSISYSVPQRRRNRGVYICRGQNWIVFHRLFGLAYPNIQRQWLGCF